MALSEPLKITLLVLMCAGLAGCAASGIYPGVTTAFAVLLWFIVFFKALTAIADSFT